jgi:YVTN family beta-propeller protein
MKMVKVAVALAAAFVLGVAQGAVTTLATPTLGNQSLHLCSDAVLDKAFVPNFGDGTMSVVDLNTLQVTATFPVGPSPRRVVCNTATHRVYVVNTAQAGTVTVVDGTSNAIVATIPVGKEPRTIGSNLFVDEIYVSNNGGNTVSIIDTRTSAVVATVTVGAEPLSPSSNNTLKKVYVPSSVDGTVTVIDQPTRTTKTIKVGNGPQYAAVDAQHGKVYVNNVNDWTMSVIDSATDTVVRTLPTGAGTTSNFGVVNAVYRRVYLPNAGDNSLTVIDTDAMAVVRTIPVGNAPQTVAVDAGGGNVYVVNQGSNSVSLIDAATEAVIGAHPVGVTPSRVFEASDRLLVLNTNGSNPDSLTIATKQNTITGTEIATEFYHAGFNHYFHTADTTETELILDGLFDDNWHRTFEFWRVWTEPGPGRVPVCRFFSPSFAPKSSHFYTPYPVECATLQAGGVWTLESDAVFYLALTDTAGNCGAGTIPLYRTYNNGSSGAPNHRYMVSRAVRDQMVADGWTAEGNGPDVIFACMPTVTGK